jgi:hypothetical protein
MPQAETHQEAMEMDQDLLMLTIGDYIRDKSHSLSRRAA